MCMFTVCLCAVCVHIFVHVFVNTCVCLCLYMCACVHVHGMHFVYALICLRFCCELHPPPAAMSRLTISGYCRDTYLHPSEGVRTQQTVAKGKQTRSRQVLRNSQGRVAITIDIVHFIIAMDLRARIRVSRRPRRPALSSFET